MRNFLLALALVALPTVAPAAPQQVTFQFGGAVWYYYDSTPPIVGFDGQPVPALTAGIIATSAKPTDALRSLNAVAGQRFRCTASAFLAGDDAYGTVLIGVKSINAKTCVLVP